MGVEKTNGHQKGDEARPQGAPLEAVGGAQRMGRSCQVREGTSFSVPFCPSSLHCGNSSEAKAYLVFLCGQEARLLFLTSVWHLVSPGDLILVFSIFYLLLCAYVSYAGVCVLVYVHV